MKWNSIKIIRFFFLSLFEWVKVQYEDNHFKLGPRHLSTVSHDITYYRRLTDRPITTIFLLLNIIGIGWFSFCTFFFSSRCRGSFVNWDVIRRVSGSVKREGEKRNLPLQRAGPQENDCIKVVESWQNCGLHLVGQPWRG